MPSSKVAVVTGGNKGIGYAIVKGLCENFEGTVYLTARDVKRGKEAVANLKKLHLKPTFHQLDITNEKSIKKFRNYLKEKHGGLDLLINNAAVLIRGEKLIVQAEITLSVNYFSTLKVCEILFPLLRPNARVVNISSSEGHLSKIPSTDLRSKFNDPTLSVLHLNQLMEKFIQDVKTERYQEEGWGMNHFLFAYSISKIGINALTKIQQREFDREQPNRNISVNSVHPGFVKTDMTEHEGFWSTEEGARAPLYVALEAENLKGEFIWCNGTIVKWDAATPPVRY